MQGVAGVSLIRTRLPRSPGARVARLVEDHVGAVALHHFAVPQEHRAVAQPAGLLGQVGDQDDGDLPAQFLEHVLDAHGGDGVDGDGELVQAEDLRLVGQRARDGQALLLAAGQPGAQRVQAVLDLVPQRGLAQALLDQAVQLAAVAQAGAAGGEGHVVVDGEGQADRQRGHHADLAAQLVDVAQALHVLAVHLDRARWWRAGRELDGAVQAAQQRGLARLGGADDGEDLAGRHVEADPVQDLLAAVGQAQVADFDAGGVAHGPGHHFFLARSTTRSVMEAALTSSTAAISTVAMA
jgi:hypothetical protein